MHIAAVSVFPEMFDAVARHGITARALEQGLWQLTRVNPRDYADDAHRSVDDRPYGGGPGMVMTVEPLRSAIAAARERTGGGRVIYLSPQGVRLDQAGVQRLAELPSVVLLCGRYEGVDERLIEAEVDEELSVGDYVLSGGELAAMVVIEAATRLLAGTLGHAESASQDSFSGALGLLDCPHYTRPAVIDGRAVPPVLLSGDHEAVRRWRLKQSLGRTWLRRPELLSRQTLDSEARVLLDEFKQEHAAPQRASA
ncbi:MAG: tRNA (guanosine(37)-N1)-methyltransferase TrmD [Gammaproteobacteria bacterium]